MVLTDSEFRGNCLNAPSPEPSQPPMSVPLTASTASSRRSQEATSSSNPIPLGVLGFALVNLAALGLLPFLQLGDGSNIPRLALFLGRFHPVVLHVPIGMILLAIILEHAHVRGLRRWIPKIPAGTSTFLIFFAAMSASVSTVLGWMLSYSGGYEPVLLQRHFIAGLATGIGANLALLVKVIADARPTDRVARYAFQFILLGTGACLGLAGHWGASITHGEDYLTEYAPDSIRHLLGLPVRIDPANLPWKPLPERVAFNEVVEPILNDRCVSCHSGQKAKGGLRLDRYDLVMKGGNSGAAVVPSEPTKSLLLKYIDLPDDDEKHMPPKGKTQLTDDEQAVLAWWVGAGAPDEKTIGALAVPAAVQLAMERAVPEAIRQKEEAAERAQAEKVVAALGPLQKGLRGSLRLIVPGEPNLEYDAGADHAQVDDAQLRKLEPLGENMVLLDLSRTRISDAGLDAVAKMPKLTRLELQETNIGDAGLQQIVKLPALEVLNIYDTHVTDKGLAGLTTMAKLQRVYVGRTRVTATGIQNLRKRMPQVNVVEEEIAKVPPGAATTPLPEKKKPEAAKVAAPAPKAEPKAAAVIAHPPAAVPPAATKPVQPAQSPKPTTKTSPKAAPAALLPSAAPASKVPASTQGVHPVATVLPKAASPIASAATPISKVPVPSPSPQPAVKVSPKAVPVAAPISKAPVPSPATQPVAKVSPKAAPLISPAATPISKAPATSPAAQPVAKVPAKAVPAVSPLASPVSKTQAAEAKSTTVQAASATPATK